MMKPHHLLSLAGLAVIGLSMLTTGCEASDGEKREETEIDTTIQRFKQFTCDTNAVPGVAPINDVDGTQGDQLAIEPSGECQFNLLYTSPTAGVTRLNSDKPGGYLIAVAGQAQTGQRIVCATNIVHERTPKAKVSGGEVDHQIKKAYIECASFDGAKWSPMKKIVDGGKEWAAWALSVKPATNGGRYQLRYTRDFSFQFMNIGDKGRPAGDGVYDVFLEIGPDGPKITRTQRYSELTSPEESTAVGAWVPTQAEIDEYAPHIRVDNGRCPPPGGCPPR